VHKVTLRHVHKITDVEKQHGVCVCVCARACAHARIVRVWRGVHRHWHVLVHM
jgi:hypothetical protein